jgi:hypothetical protein
MAMNTLFQPAALGLACAALASCAYYPGYTYDSRPTSSYVAAAPVVVPTAPAYVTPAYVAPTYVTPAYVTPAYVAPVVASPVYGSRVGNSPITANEEARQSAN